MENKLEREGLQEKLLGHALFSIRNEETGKHFTFKIITSYNKNIFYVYQLTGPNNTYCGDYNYIGHINMHTRILRCKHKVFKYFWKHLTANTLPKQITVHHSGRCMKCNRLLTSPQSILDGIGPVCAGRM